MTPRRTAVLPVILACVLTSAACASTVQGRGAAVSPVQISSATASSTTPTESDTPSGDPTPAVTTTSTSAAPVAQPPPAQCPGGNCPIVGTAGLGSGYVAILRSGTPTNGGIGASVLELTRNGVPVDWHAADDLTPGRIVCLPGADGNCVVTGYEGAHGSSASVWRLGLDSARLVMSASADADTPTITAHDLNGDGFLDVLGLQNDYKPDYATGHVQWQTWLFDGKTLTSTGCTPLATTPPPRPVAPATGPCSAG